MPRLLLIDGNSIMNRTFYGLSGSNMLKTSDGIYTNAIFGFLNILHKYLNDKEYTHFAVAFDRSEPTFRHEMFAGYKADRKGMPDELAMQMPLIRQLLGALGISTLEAAGIEADDLIGTYSKQASQKGIEVTILSGDKDLFQLIDERIRIDYPSSRNGVSESATYDRAQLFERYGIEPEQFVELKALMGDSSDNIPGVKGIGEKGAVKLIKEFGSIDNIYANLGKVSPDRTRRLLEENREMCYLSRELSSISTDVAHGAEVENFSRAQADKEKLADLFRKLQFSTLAEKFGLSSEKSVKTSDKRAIRFCDPKCDSETAAQFAGQWLYLSFDHVKTPGRYELKNIYMMSENTNIYYFDSLKSLSSLLMEVEICGICVFDSKPLFGSEDSLGEILKRPVFDISLAAYLLDPDVKADTLESVYLKYMGSRLCGTDEKPQLSLLEEENSFDDPGKCVFCEALAELKHILEPKLKETKLEMLYYDIEIPVARVLSSIEKSGILADRQVLLDLDRKLSLLLDELEKSIVRIAGVEFNINSPKQLGEILFEKLRLPVLKKTKTGYSTNAEVLEMLRGRHEIISHILDYRQYDKLRGTYSKGLLSQIAEDGRIYSTFNQKIAATGRLSSQDPNLQNIPVKLEQGREFRKAFVAGPGNVLIDADYSQIELRVLAHFSKDEKMLEIYNRDEDIHSQTALYIFSEEDISKITPAMRNSAKTVNFSVIYGISAYSLSIDLGITRQEAQIYIDEYFEKYPGVRKYMDAIIEEAKVNGYVRTLFGRIRYLPEISSSNFNIRSFWERVAMNTPIQGTAADIIKLAMIRVHDALNKGDCKARLVLQVHDELIVECPESEADMVEQLMREAMEGACSLDVPLKADIRRGKNWYETK